MAQRFTASTETLVCSRPFHHPLLGSALTRAEKVQSYSQLHAELIGVAMGSKYLMQCSLQRSDDFKSSGLDF